MRPSGLNGESMRTCLLLLVLSASTATAQTTHLIRGLDFFYDPDTVVMLTGDSIRYVDARYQRQFLTFLANLNRGGDWQPSYVAAFGATVIAGIVLADALF